MQASRDQNSVPTLLGVSNVDGSTPVTIYADPVTHRLLVDLAGSGGIPGGNDTDVQYNDAGNFGGDSGFTYDKAGSATLTQTIFSQAAGLRDTNASNYLLLEAGSDLTANRIITLVTGDAARTITLSGNPTLSDWFDQSVKQASTPVFAGANLSSGTTTLGTIAGSIDATSATFLKVPNSNAPTLNANGQVAVDNAVTSYNQGILKYYSTAEMGAVAMPVANFDSPTDGYVVTYDAASGAFKLAASGAGAGANTALSNLASVAINTALLPGTAGALDFGSTAKPWAAIWLAGTSGTPATNQFKITGASTGGLRTITLPDASGTVTVLGNTTTGSGAIVLATSPTFVTPILGTPASGTLTNCTGLPISTGVSGLGTGIATFLATPSSANLAAAVTDETGSGALVFGTTPTITTPVLNGTPTGTGVATAATVSTLALRDTNGNLTTVNFLEGYSTTATAAGTTTLTVSSNNTQYFTGATTQTVQMPDVTTLALGQSWWIVNLSTGAVTVNSSGGNAIVILAAGTSAEITCIATSGTTAASWNAMYIGTSITSAKKLSVSNTLTLAGTDGTTMTFPSSSDTVVTLTATQTLTNKRVTSRVTAISSNSATPTINTDNCDYVHITAQTNNITSMTTNLSGTPTDGQMLRISLVASSGTPTVTWGTSFEDSTVTAPTALSTTRVDVGFVWNNETSKWRCVAKA